MYTTTTNNSILFCDYYKQWITVYKEGAIRPVTMNKYNMAHQWLEKLIRTWNEGSTQDLAKAVVDEAVKRRKAEREDDVTAVAIRITDNGR